MKLIHLIIIDKYYEHFWCFNFVNYLYTPESSSGIPGSTGSTVMQGSHKGAVVCPRAPPAEVMSSYFHERAQAEPFYISPQRFILPMPIIGQEIEFLASSTVN